MRWTLTITLLSLLFLAACSTVGQTVSTAPQRARARRSINLFVGTRELDDGAWKPVDDQEAIGIDVEFESAGGVGWEAGVFASDDSSGSFDGSTLELFGGLHRSFAGTYARIRPYLAGGLSVLTSDLEGPGFSENDFSVGIYVRAGLSIWITDMVSFGLDWRRLFGTQADLGGVDDVDYEQFSLVLGFAF